MKRSASIMNSIALIRRRKYKSDMLRLDLADEQWAIKHYAALISEFLPGVDDETLTVLEENLKDELRHARWLRDRLGLLVPSE